MRLCFFICFVTLLFIYRVWSAKILCIFPVQAKSHFILTNKITQLLLQHGHQVTVISPYLQKNNAGNLRVVKFESNVLDASRELLFDTSDMLTLIQIFNFYKMTNKLVEISLNASEVQHLLKSKSEHFDLIILESFNTDIYLALGHHFNAPIILLSTIGSSNLVNDLTGNPAPFAYLPDLFLSYTDQMSSFQRLHNTLILTIHQLYRQYIVKKHADQIIQQHFPNSPKIDELRKRISLVLMNSHVSINHPRPHLPNMIEIGGYHIDDPKPLPKDLQNFLDNAHEGVIYFSMGSNLKSVLLPEAKRKKLLNVFAKQKMQVLWKWEDDNLPGKPDNVKIAKWLPQQDILAHKNVKLFITHGGLLSTIEAVYFGVPIIGIPMFGDQRMNIAYSQIAGYGLKVDYTTLTEESLSNAINEILDNLKYRKNIKARSAIMKDRQNKPIDTAIYWIEFVLRHNGAYHMQSKPAIQLQWIEYFLIDIMLFLGAGLYIFYKLVTYLFLIIFCKKNFRHAQGPNNDSKQHNE